MSGFKANAPALVYATPSTKLFVLGMLSLLMAVLVKTLETAFLQMDIAIAFYFADYCNKLMCILFVIGIGVWVIAIVLHIILPDRVKIKYMVRRKLFLPAYGNPLHLKEGEQLPRIKVKRGKAGKFIITITASSSTVKEIQEISSNISSGLDRGRYRRYAVTQTDTDVAYNSVSFYIEDVTVDRSLVVHSAGELKSQESTKLIVQNGTYIDLTTSGSMIFAGKTRSGKTTGVISILLQVLLFGRDEYHSEIVIIDPKQAELSRLPHVYTLDADSEAKGILAALQRFADTIVKRQKALNDLSEQRGDAVHWWEAGFHVSLLFIDEYVALRGIFPKRAGKEDSEYSLATFDALIKRIVTMGASAGCYAIISIAEASVDEGGFPAMLRSACSTKVLFKPTVSEGRFLWDSDRIKDMPERIYNAGDAWLSSTDGIHDNVSYVHFPKMEFPVYRELGRLLAEYYKEP